MRKIRTIMVALSIVFFSAMLPMQASAADTSPTAITSGETVYGTVGYKLYQNYTISVYGSGDLILDLKTPSSIYIYLWDNNKNEIPPFDYQEQTKYGSHAGHDIGGYYLRYGNDTSTKTAHAIFYYKVSPGEYTLRIESWLGISSPFEMTLTLPIGFIDVETGIWFEQEVNWAVENKITYGVGGGKFDPYADCSQIQILTMLWRAVGEPSSNVKAPISVASYYKDAVNWAFEKGIIDDQFAPDTPCTRSLAVYYIWSAMGRPAAEASSFSDVNSSDPVAKAIDWAVAKNVTAGTGNNSFSPDKVCNRAEIATFLYRAYA